MNHLLESAPGRRTGKKEKTFGLRQEGGYCVVSCRGPRERRPSKEPRWQLAPGRSSAGAWAGIRGKTAAAAAPTTARSGIGVRTVLHADGHEVVALESRDHESVVVILYKLYFVDERGGQQGVSHGFGAFWHRF